MATLAIKRVPGGEVVEKINALWILKVSEGQSWWAGWQPWGQQAYGLSFWGL